MSPAPDRHAIVTGSASGLGAAVVGRLREEGWRVAGLDLAGATGDITHDVDVTDADGVHQAVSAIAAEFGRVDGVAHCAGIFRNTLAPVHALDRADWARTIDVNLTGSFTIAQATLPHLMGSNGTIVMTASTAADHSQPGGAAYAVSKAGVRALTRSIALEYAPHGVRACSVSPGYMRTGMTAKVLSREDILASIEASIPLGRVSDPVEVAHTIAFLLSPQAGFLTGQDVTVDGGGALMAYVGTGDVDGMWSRHARRPAPIDG